MNQQLKDKSKLFRILHGITHVYISNDGELFKDEPTNFTGKSLWWYKNGQLKWEENFKNGEAHGKSLGWFETGQLKYEHNYKNGNYHGKCLSWYDNGQLFYEEYWKNGELID